MTLFGCSCVLWLSAYSQLCLEIPHDNNGQLTLRADELCVRCSPPCPSVFLTSLFCSQSHLADEQTQASKSPQTGSVEYMMELGLKTTFLNSP